MCRSPVTKRGGADAAYTTLEEYFATTEGAEIYSVFEEELVGDDSATTSLKVEGNVVIYTYSMSEGDDRIALSDYSEEDQAEILAGMQATMPETMEALSSMFTPAVDVFEEASGLDDVTLKVVYTDANGELLYEHEFTN